MVIVAVMIAMMVMAASAAGMVVVMAVFMLVMMFAGTGVLHIISAFQHSYEQLFICNYMPLIRICQ